MNPRVNRRAQSLSSLILSFAVVVCLGHAASAQLVPGTQIQTAIRPGVWIQDSGGAGTQIGIYDSGDSKDTLSRDTAMTVNVPPTTPTVGPAGTANMYNQGTTAAQNITSGGWLGATLQGPDLPTPAPPAGWPDAQIAAGNPGHVFTNSSTLARSSPATSNGILPSYRDYNGRFSENHTGQAFVTSANPVNDLAVMVDPINATPLPFPYDNTRAGNGRGLSGASVAGNPPLDSTTSSVSYLPQGNSRIPSLTTDANPGFTYNIELIPSEFADTLTPAAANVNVVAGLPAGVTRQVVERVSTANGPTVTGIIANNSYPNGTFSPPTYLPFAAGPPAGLPPTTSFTFNVSNAAVGANPNLAMGGLENRNGFAVTNGSVQVVVQYVNGAGNTVNAPNLNGGNPVTVALASQAPRPYAVVSGPAAGVGAFGATSFLFDTGAPDTSVPMAVFNTLPDTGAGNPRVLPQLNIALVSGGNLTLNNVPVGGTNGTPLVGTNVTNQFGQVWNYAPVGAAVDAANPNRGALTLTGPINNPGIMSLMANGIVFTVDTGTSGLQGSGVNQLATYGTVPQLQPGNGAPTDSGNTPGAAGTVYRTDLTGSNASYIDTSASQLALGEVITGLSLGADPVRPSGRLYFSVTTNSVGQPASAVNQQSLLRQTGADIYTVPSGQPQPYGTPSSNSLLINQEVLGLGSNVGPRDPAVAQNADQLRDFKVNTRLALPAVSLSNLDSPMTTVGDAGTVSRRRVGQDILGVTFDTYFTTNQRGPNIFKNTVGNLFAASGQMGLEMTDQINSLALYRPTVGPGVPGAANVQPGTRLWSLLLQNAVTGLETYAPNEDASFDGIDAFHGGSSDVALFTLAPGSPSLFDYNLMLAQDGLPFPLSPADVFITDFNGTFGLYANPDSLGLLPTDSIVGLDIAVPEPPTIALLAAGMMGIALVTSRRGKRRARQIGN